MRFYVLAVLVALAVVAPAAASPRTQQSVPIKVTVVAKEFSFKFSRASVPHGSTVIFTVENKGQLDHNLVFLSINKHTSLLAPGKKATLRIAFAKKGRFYYDCSVPNHAEEGMAGAFVVT